MEIKQGKHLSIRVPIAQKAVRVEKIGPEYTEAMLRLYFDDRAEYERIKADTRPKKIERLAKNAEYNKYPAVQNINVQIRMMNKLGEYGIKSYTELSDKIAELEQQEKAFDNNIKQLKTKIGMKKSIIRSVRGYWRVKPVYEKYKSIKDPAEKELFEVEHTLELREHEKAVEIMNDSKLSDGTLPKAESLNAEILSEEKMIADYNDKMEKIKIELYNFKLIKENVDSIAGEKPEKEANHKTKNITISHRKEK